MVTSWSSTTFRHAPRASELVRQALAKLEECLRDGRLVTEPTVKTFAEALPSAFVSAIPAAEPAAGPFAPT